MPLDSPFDSLRGIRSPFGGRRLAQIITAITPPTLGAITDGDTLENKLTGVTLSNFQSTAGDIVSVTAEAFKNGVSVGTVVEETLVSQIFAASEPGAWFENNDIATLFTDTPGTTPVSEPGDAVAYQVDKSGNGNHRTQATAAARPLYARHPKGGVRNELVSTDTLATQNVTVTAAQRAISFKGTGSITLSGAATGTLTGTGAEDVVSLTFTPTAGTLTATVSGAVNEAQLELGTARTNYQTVGASFLDVSEAGVPSRGRLWYNGTSHFMETGTITPGTDKVQVFAGLRKLGSTTAILAELSENLNDNTGAMYLGAPYDASDGFAFASKGTKPGIGSMAKVAGNLAPTTNTLTAFGDISGDLATLRIDGTQVAQNTGDQGTGNHLAYPLYYGARAGTSFFFNGYEDTSVVRFGPNLDQATIDQVEAHVANLTPEETIV